MYRYIHDCQRYAAHHNLITSRVISVLIIILLLIATAPAVIFASAPTELSTLSSRNYATEARPTLYLDCQRCDYNHIREEITFVNYVRDQEQSDIHLFITAQSTGDGGTEYELSFIGRNGFAEMNYTFAHTTGRDMTWSEIRDSLNDAIRMGLAPFMMRTPLGDRFALSYDEFDDDEWEQLNDTHDPWNNWVFQVYAGRMQLRMESNRRDFSSRWGFFADRVTHDWKLRFRPYFNYDFEELDQSDGETVSSHRHRHGIDSYVIKSLTDHWSAGFFADYQTRFDRNLKHDLQISPGIEYSLFPYQQATRRAIIFRYNLGYNHRDYYDMTIYEKENENLVRQRLLARARYQQPWGSIFAGITGSHYFHDTTLRRLQTFTRFSLRLAEGLNLSLQTDYDIIQDQLALRAGDLDLEDILLARQELATDYSFRVMVAISYSFGSDFANIVNTRF